MNKIFDEYGLFILAVITGILCISIFLALFVGEDSIVGPLISTFVERLI